MCVGKNVRNEGRREKENRRKGRRKRGLKRVWRGLGHARDDNGHTDFG